MTAETEKPFYQRPLPPIKRPGETGVLAVTDPQDTLNYRLKAVTVQAPSVTGLAIVPLSTVIELPLASAPVVNGGEAVAGEASSPPPVPRLAPNVVLANAVQALDEARYEARLRRDAVAAARENFNIALRDWNRTFPVQTVDDAKRELFRTNQAERARKASQGTLRRPATVSETARAYGGGGHNVQRGHGRSYARGALSKAQALEVTANRLREAAAARMNGSAAPRIKLPSEK